MAYFVGGSGNHYVSLFFARKDVNRCSGTLLALTRGGMRLTSFLPVLAGLIGMATIAEICAWAAFIFAPPQQPGSMLTQINWIVAWVSVFSAVVGAAIISYSQFHPMKHKTFFYGGADCSLSIDWARSLAMFLINILFALNGILFSLWADFAASPIDAGESDDSVALTLAGFVALAVPGALRLIWLFKVRGFSSVSWGPDSPVSRLK